jgi:hypothetical protein
MLNQIGYQQINKSTDQPACVPTRRDSAQDDSLDCSGATIRQMNTSTINSTTRRLNNSTEKNVEILQKYH